MQNYQCSSNFFFYQDVPSRKYNVFIGATIFAKLIKDTPSAWVTKDDWEEYGPEVIRRLNSCHI